jgi:hypothetical protein
MEKADEKAAARVLDDKPEQQKTIEVTCFV